MDEEQEARTREIITRLQNLSIRATGLYVVGHGSAHVIIYATDVYALNDAVTELEKTLSS